MTGCLLLIDFQKGFLTDMTAGALDSVRRLLSAHGFDHVAATRFVNTDEGPYARFMDWHRFLEGSSESELDPFVAGCAERVFEKHVYTSLTDGFLEYLRDEGIDEVYVAGIDTDCCVLSTSLALFERCIPFKVLMDCTASNGGPASYDAARTVLLRLVGAQSLVDDSVLFFTSKR